MSITGMLDGLKFTRKNNRDIKEIRQIGASFDVIKESTGSVRLHQGNTSVICSIAGPTAVKQKNEKIDAATIEVIFVPSCKISDPKDREFEMICQTVAEQMIICSMYPRSLISICIQEVHNDGSVSFFAPLFLCIVAFCYY